MHQDQEAQEIPGGASIEGEQHGALSSVIRRSVADSDLGVTTSCRTRARNRARLRRSAQAPIRTVQDHHLPIVNGRDGAQWRRGSVHAVNQRTSTGNPRERAPVYNKGGTIPFCRPVLRQELEDSLLSDQVSRLSERASAARLQPWRLPSLRPSPQRQALVGVSLVTYSSLEMICAQRVREPHWTGVDKMAAGSESVVTSVPGTQRAEDGDRREPPAGLAGRRPGWRRASSGSGRAWSW